MRLLFRTFFLILLTLAASTPAASMSRHYGKSVSALPLEARQLIGKTLPSTQRTDADGVHTEMYGDIPNFVYVTDGGSAGGAISATGDAIVFYVGFLKKQSVLIVNLLNQDGVSRTIVDVKLLPKALLEMQLKASGEIFEKKDGYRFSDLCEIAESSSNYKVVALVIPERDKRIVAHRSQHVKQAWRVSLESGKLTEISTHKISCYTEPIDDRD